VRVVVRDVPRARLPEVALLSVVLVFASTFILGKQIFTEISPLAFAGSRFVGITVLAFAVLAVAVHRGSAAWSIWRVDLWRFIVVGVCGHTLYQLGFVLGLERTSPFSSALLISTVPLFTIVLLTLLGEQQPRIAWLGVAVALLGIAVFEIDKWARRAASSAIC
jgi:drug/metabolite transporter (DMT)-like permease